MSNLISFEDEKAEENPLGIVLIVSNKNYSNVPIRTGVNVNFTRVYRVFQKKILSSIKIFLIP